MALGVGGAVTAGAGGQSMYKHTRKHNGRFIAAFELKTLEQPRERLPDSKIIGHYVLDSANRRNTGLRNGFLE